MALSRMRHRRLDRGLTLLDLFRETGLQPSRLSLVERLHVSPRADERARIASALEADEAELFSDLVTDRQDGAGV